ncbi:hypothetical protein HN011_001306, partial [Eciton burchellii]
MHSKCRNVRSEYSEIKLADKLLRWHNEQLPSLAVFESRSLVASNKNMCLQSRCSIAKNQLRLQREADGYNITALTGAEPNRRLPRNALAEVIPLNVTSSALMTSRSPAIIRIIIERQNEQSSRQRSKDLGKRKEALLDGEPSAMSFSESFSSARSTFMIPDE